MDFLWFWDDFGMKLECVLDVFGIILVSFSKLIFFNSAHFVRFVRLVQDPPSALVEKRVSLPPSFFHPCQNVNWS